MDTPIQSTSAPSEVISPTVRELLSSYQHEENYYSRQENTANVSVSRAASALALVYERIRQSVDYQDEQVLRRRAIERILLRRLTTAKNGEKTIAEGLIKELTWARYIDNNTIPIEHIDAITEILKRYKVLLERNTYKQTKKLPDLRDWIIGVMATEIEQLLVPHFVNDALVLLMYRSLNHAESAPEVDEATKNLQIFLTIQRALLKADKAVLRFQLLNSYYPDWKKNIPELTHQVADQFIQAVEAIEYHLNHPLGERLLPTIRKQSAPFLILRSVVEKHKRKSNEVLADQDKREAAIEEICAERYQVARQKVQRAAIRSLIYLLITKIVLALVVERGFDLWVYGETHWIPLIINILFPLLIMLIVAVTIRIPGKKNTQKIIKRLNAVIDDPDGRNALELRIPKVKMRSNTFVYFYVATFVVTFGLIGYILFDFLGYTIVAALLFFFFNCLVSFFAFRIRQIARELVVVDDKESFLTAVFDFFFLPFLRVGRWLSQAFSRINIFIFIFDFILEAPLKSLISIAEEWFSFIREKKEEIV